MSKYWLSTSDGTYETWKKLKDIIDNHVKTLELCFATENNPELKEECRMVLNEIYQSQYQLEHMYLWR